MTPEEAAAIRQQVMDYGPTQCAELNLMIRIEQTLKFARAVIARVDETLRVGAAS